MLIKKSHVFKGTEPETWKCYLKRVLSEPVSNKAGGIQSPNFFKRDSDKVYFLWILLDF